MRIQITCSPIPKSRNIRPEHCYHKLLERSSVADFANYAPGKGAGASVTACFLEKFVEPGTRWIHLDMVGPSVIRSETEEMRERGPAGPALLL